MGNFLRHARRNDSNRKPNEATERQVQTPGLRSEKPPLHSSHTRAMFILGPLMRLAERINASVQVCKVALKPLLDFSYSESQRLELALWNLTGGQVYRARRAGERCTLKLHRDIALRRVVRHAVQPLPEGNK